MKLQYFFFLFFFINLLAVSAQRVQLSPSAQISVLTCGPGEELYSTFGHSAFRVQDPSQGIDVVYNYGTFDFDTPNFYLKFTRGKLLYQLSRTSFSRFLYTYQLENRWVKEQLLALTPEQTNTLFQFLEQNNLPENKAYKYDFFFDNCSSRIRDVLGNTLDNHLDFKASHLENQYTFRALIHQNLTTNSWSSFGIDLALGAIIDRKATQKEHMFLPQYVLEQLSNTTLGSKNLVLRERDILDAKNTHKDVYFLASPLFWFLLLLVFVMAITYIDFKNSFRSRSLDLFLFLLTGIAGLIILLLWFATDHSATANNFNFLWVFPGNLVVAFLMLRKKKSPKWLDTYMLVLLGGIALTLILWIIGVQQFSPLIVPLLLLLSVRYAFLYRWYTTRKQLRS